MKTPPSKSTEELFVADAAETPTAITEEERQKRVDAINFARGSVRLDGFVLTAEVEELNARYIEGELSSDAHRSAILAIYKAS